MAVDGSRGLSSQSSWRRWPTLPAYLIRCSLGNQGLGRWQIGYSVTAEAVTELARNAVPVSATAEMTAASRYLILLVPPLIPAESPIYARSKA
jgi:hypothetical protein